MKVTVFGIGYVGLVQGAVLAEVGHDVVCVDVDGTLVDGLDGAGDPTINYKLDKAIADPWNMLLGAELDLSRRVQLRAEAGFIGRFSILFGVNYRLPI